MILKSLELRGFKSFADKTELNFNNGITAIVGPNGSGKSNISDAVKWVLGEQSAKSIRGGKMEDVIFVGTDFRKPLGLCQVSLTFDNSSNRLPLEYSDVSISRRLYRSGESEYYINNTQCRLKDIQELFMDTGIGKEGYSIIGQGKIEAILSGKSEDRRSLLEEAAGIVKFKTRKEEAEKKLENTNNNLIRINDILTTLEERLEPLCKEKEKAESFLHISKDLKEKEINIVLKGIDGIGENLNNLCSLIEKHENQYNGLLLQHKDLQKTLTNLNEQYETLEKKIVDRKNEYYSIKDDISEKEKQCLLLEEKISNGEILWDNTIKEKLSYENRKQKLEENRLKIELELKEKKKEQINLEDNIRNLENEKFNLANYISQNTKKITEIKEEQFEELTYISNLKNDISNLNSKIDNSNKKIESLLGNCEGIKNSININKNTRNILNSNIEDIKNKIQQLESTIKNNKKEIWNNNNLLLEKEKKIREVTAEYTKKLANQNMLINLEKAYEGYMRAVKILMQHVSSGKLPECKEKCFVLGEVLNTNKEYETAIEISLGGAISDIITENEVLAKKMIDYLKINKLGRATFLPLSIIKSKKLIIREDIKSMDGYIGIASELVHYDEKFRTAIEYVIGRTLICRDMNSALKIAKKSGYTLKIVTLEGEVVNPGGSLTGGSIPSKSSNIIGRKREIDELQMQISNLKFDLKNYSSELEELKVLIKSLDDKNLDLKENIYNENIQTTKILGEINNIDTENQKLNKDLNIYTLEIKNLKDSLKEDENNLLKYKEKLDFYNENQKNKIQELANIEKMVKLKGEKAEKIREDVTIFKVKKAQVDEIVANFIKELYKIDKSSEESNASIKEYEKTLNDLVNNKENYKNSLHSLKKDIKNGLEYIGKYKSDFEEEEAERVKLKEGVKVYTSKEDSLKEEIRIKENDIFRAKLNKEKLVEDREKFYTKLNEELGVNYAEALVFKKEILNEDELKKEIAALKNKINSLGVVNVGAINEYKEVKEKYSFMKSQKDDLINAIEELKNVIESLTENMRKVFLENFNTLRVYFNETFRELFKGGSADLILSGEDVLSSNIEIHVQPPGKKVQNINLMSGGEKGLSAIALLFAILKMKPTPFCIVDEIEAALDDANVSRFAEFLRRFSKEVQFVVITHRKGTMESSDALYGVTMEEKGVSKIVSVSLNKD